MTEAPLIRPHPKLARFTAILAAFALVVIVFGAFVRLSNAGMSCPDWPLCYGRVTWPVHAHEIDAANAAFPERPVDVDRAWREQVHRFIAGLLMLGTFALAIVTFRGRRERGMPWRSASAVAALIVFQALLGMWTVTWKLSPIVVMAHLMGGMTTLALLVWIGARAWGVAADARAGVSRGAIVASLVLLSAQIALGGWTSANYAALACGDDFPTCLDAWWPTVDFSEAFVLWRGIGVDYEGGILDAPARRAIHLTHRLFAVLVTLALVVVSARALRIPEWRVWGGLLLGGIVLQVSLGIANVWAGMPLWAATAHNGIAAVLIGVLVVALARTTRA